MGSRLERGRGQVERKRPANEKAGIVLELGNVEYENNPFIKDAKNTGKVIATVLPSQGVK